MTTKNRRGQRPAAESREHPYLLDRNGVLEDRATRGTEDDRARFLAVSFREPAERTGRGAL